MSPVFTFVLPLILGDCGNTFLCDLLSETEEKKCKISQNNGFMWPEGPKHSNSSSLKFNHRMNKTNSLFQYSLLPYLWDQFLLISPVCRVKRKGSCKIISTCPLPVQGGWIIFFNSYIFAGQMPRLWRLPVGERHTGLQASGHPPIDSGLELSRSLQVLKAGDREEK